jgi:hypothetical protein
MFPILDVSCGSKMFWFDRNDPRVVFMDKRSENHEYKDSSVKSGKRILIVDPEIIGDFTSLPFQRDSFSLVVFDPPHLINNGSNGWMAKKYGKLTKNWREDIRLGFSECFRVLKYEGTLILKWNENDIPVSKIIELTSYRPLFGNKCGKASKSHWIVFMKQEESLCLPMKLAGQ